MRIRYFVFYRINTAFLHLLVSVMPVMLLAQPQVTNVSPRQNEINVSPISAIEVTFSADINQSTLTSSSWLVHGSQTGRHTGIINYDPSTRTGQYFPLTLFKEGEIISVVLTSNIRNNSGQPLSVPFQWAFTIAVEYGTGIFDQRIEIPNAQNERDPVAIYTAEFNYDQYPDLAVANFASNTVSIFMNQFLTFGNSFELRSTVQVGNGPKSIAGGDFDNNGFLDLAVSNFNSNSISLLGNISGGTFMPSHTIPTAEHPAYIEAGDYNNDGKLDLAAVIFGVNRLQVFLNLGDWIFSATPDIYQTGASPFGMAAGDFDNDGDLDIVVASSGDNSIIVFKNDGQAQFTHAGEITVPDSPTIVRTNDLIGRTVPGHYGDGFLDLVIVHPNINSLTILDNRTRDGGFVMNQEFPVGARPSSVFIADVDTTDATALTSGLGKDHDLDIAVLNFFSNNLTLLRNELNNGFPNQESDVFPAGPSPLSLTGADFDCDGDIDLAATNFTGNSVSILLNRGGKSGGIRLTQPTRLLDFGRVYVGTDSTRRFSMNNPTNENIFLNEISTTLPEFTVSDAQAVIAPGQYYQLAITFSPTDTVVYEDTLTIRANGLLAQNELKLGLRGQGIRAIISVVPDTLDFGNILPPQLSALPIEIFNDGNGTLNVSELQFTNPDFSSLLNRPTVPPHSSQQVDITFSPTIAMVYLDTLTIFNNDSSHAQANVILIGGPHQHRPEITSADTVTAIEDIFFQYTATASDSDNTQPMFTFQNLPVWLSADSQNLENNSVQGTPREGDRDAFFTIIARDGIFSDSLLVYVRVIPVNDPPEFNPISDQVTQELILLTFDISATDPEDSTLVYSAISLPQGANLVNNNNNTAAFSWTPPYGVRGDYDVTFIVTEAFQENPLSDTAEVRIRVLEMLPDLTAASLGIDNTDITLNQTRLITGSAGCEIAAVQQPFRLAFIHDGMVARDTTITRIGSGQQVTFNYLATFDRLSTHKIVFYVDMHNQVPESDEENNSAVLRLNVSQGGLVVRPNPFTPNDDGFNDLAEFDYNTLVLEQPKLKIFEFSGSLLATFERSTNSKFQWDGRDESGREQKPGIYLYVLSDNEK